MLFIILGTIVAIIAIILLIAAIMPKDSNLSVDVVINRKKEDVFNYVKHIKNQTHYNKWVMADPNVKIVYTGTDGTVGFKAAWSSEDKNVGVGEQEIISITDGERYDLELRFEKPFKGVSYSYTATQAISDNQTKVTNTFISKTPFPMNIMLPVLKNMLLKDMNQSLLNLKQVLETK